MPLFILVVALVGGVVLNQLLIVLPLGWLQHLSVFKWVVLVGLAGFLAWSFGE